MLLPLPSTCYNMFSIEMINPNYMTHLDHVDRIIITWSEWRESNPRPHGPEPLWLRRNSGTISSQNSLKKARKALIYLIFCIFIIPYYRRRCNNNLGVPKEKRTDFWNLCALCALNDWRMHDKGKRRFVRGCRCCPGRKQFHWPRL